MKKLLVLLILLSGCVTERRCNQKFPPNETIKDSTVITHEIVKHDTLIRTYVEIPKLNIKDSTVIIYQNGTFKVAKIVLKGRYSEASAWIEGSRLKGELSEGGFIQLASLITYYEKRVSELRTQKKTIIKEVKYIPKTVKILAWIGGVFLLIVILYTGVHFYLKFSPIKLNL